MSGPQVELTGGGVLVGVGLIVGGLLIWAAYKKGPAMLDSAADAAEQAAWAVTPWNNDNVIYGGVNSVGGAITGDSSFSLGSWIYDVTHPEPTPAPSYTSGGGGQFNGHGATGGW